MKPCSGPCGSWLPNSAYYVDLRMRDGLSCWCKDCQRASARASSRRRYRVKGTMRQARAWNGQFARGSHG